MDDIADVRRTNGSINSPPMVSNKHPIQPTYRIDIVKSRRLVGIFHVYSRNHLQEIVYGPPPPDRLKTSFTQTLADYFDCVGCWSITLMFIFGPSIMLLMCLIPTLWIFGLLYLLWMYHDRQTPHAGGRK